MNILYPKLHPRWLLAMLKHAGIGGVLGGVYGVVHNEITYSISQEYFACVKFQQFRYLDFGFPPRVLVAEIGIVAGGVAGFCAGWFLARVTVPAWPAKAALRRTMCGLLVVLAGALMVAGVGWLVGMMRGPQVEGLGDLDGLVRATYVHNASYLGGLIGLVAAIVRLGRVRPENGSGGCEARRNR